MLYILVVALILALLLDFGLIAFAFTRPDRQRASCFILLAGCLVFYSLGYMLEILATTPEAATMALRVENLGIPLVAPFFLMTTLSFFQSRLLRPWMVVASFLWGFALFLVVLTNNWHHLYYASLEMPYNGVFYAVVTGKGPLYFLQQGISLLFMLLAYATLCVRFIRGSQRLRSQMLLFIIGSLFGFAANLTNILGVMPLNIDPTPFALNIGMVFFAFNLSRHKLLDIVPAAFNSAVETLDSAMIVLDNEWGFLYCNARAKMLFPSLAKFSGTEKIFLAPDWPTELIPNGPSNVTFALKQEGGTVIEQADVDAIENKRGKQIGVSILIHDITETTNMMKRLEELAITDPLTGIFNRRHFYTLAGKQLDMASRYGLKLALLMFDIDRFKRINDRFGHIAGDAVLRSTVEAVQQQLRSHDIFARYGGEEFVIMATETDENNLFAFTDRLRRTLEESPMEFEGDKIRVTASFGAVLIAPGQSYDDAIAAVDKALYEAKAGGRNMVVVGEIDNNSVS